MRQESRLPTEPLPAPGTPGEAPGARAAEPPRSRGRSGGTAPSRRDGGIAGTLTAKLMDYRDWWNLPRRSRKPA